MPCVFPKFDSNWIDNLLKVKISKVKSGEGGNSKNDALRLKIGRLSPLAIGCEKEVKPQIKTEKVMTYFFILLNSVGIIFR